MDPHPTKVPLAGRIVVVLMSLFGLVALFATAELSGVMLFMAFAGLGTYLAILRPANSIGWLLLLVGWGLGLGSVRCAVPLEALLAGQLDGFGAISTWMNACGWAIAFVGFAAIALVFPTGSMPGGRGRWPGRIVLGTTIVLAVLMAVGPTINVTLATTGETQDVPNPFAVVPNAGFWSLVPEPSFLYVGMFVLVIFAVVGLIGRYRRSSGLERLEYRWFVAAVTFFAIVTVIWAVAALLIEAAWSGFSFLVVLVGYVSIPVSIAAAVLRYRLYDIDRIISRTIAYAGVVAVLGVVFAGAVLVLSSVLASVAQAQSIAVAASTLLTYALLQPVLSRVRRAVDRRFDRTRYDAGLTAIAFADRLRTETNVEAVMTDLAATTRAVVSPTSTSLWLRPRPEHR